MQLLTRFEPPRKGPVNANLAFPLLVTALLWYSSSYDLTAAEIGAAFVLCWLPWASYRKWCRGDRQGVPLFALLSGMYWLAYIVPLFWGSHEATLVTGRRVLSETAISASLYLTLSGILALGLGMKLAAHFRWMPSIRVDISDLPNHWNYLRIIFIVGTLVKILIPITELGGGGRQIISNFENMVPSVSFAIFLRYYLRRKISDFDKFLMFGYVLIALVVGISSGWLGSFIGFGIIAMIVYTYERHKLPLTAALIVLPIILFFQPGKEAFRARYWKEGSADGYTERIAFWVESSWNMWAGATTDPTGQKGQRLADATLHRLSLLQQTANVIENTPDRVPYQYGRLYSYVAVTFIPRFLWPDKPSVNDANHWYQVSYGLTMPGQIASVSIAVGTLAESYINFGWLGPVLIMFPLGMFLGSLQRIFLHADAGLLFSSIGAVLIPQLLSVESQMAEYVAGLAQQVFVVLLILIPVFKFRGRGKVVPRRVFARSANRPEIFRSNTSLQKPPL
jgi:O-antigen polysaccharide polymerase Wzy